MTTLTNKWKIYIKDRFPIASLGLFTLLTAAAAQKYLTGNIDVNSLLIGVILLLFFFHLRLIDEFKDYTFDSEFHVSRPVQSGVISLKQLGIGTCINLVVMLLLASFTRYPSILLIALFYTLLMYKEFFIKNFYEKSPVLYLISHELVFIPLYVFTFSVFTKELFIPTNIYRLMLFLYFILPVTIIEIGRKMQHRVDHKGNKTKDTYAFIWGEKQAIIIFFILCSINASISGILLNYSISHILSFGCLICCLGIAVNNKFKAITMKNHMPITIFFAFIYVLLILK